MQSKLIALCILLILAILPSIQSAYCHGKPGDYHVNQEPIWKSQPRHIQSHKYGHLYEIG